MRKHTLLSSTPKHKKFKVGVDTLENVHIFEGILTRFSRYPCQNTFGYVSVHYRMAGTGLTRSVLDQSLFQCTVGIRAVKSTLDILLS